MEALLDELTQRRDWTGVLFVNDRIQEARAEIAALKAEVELCAQYHLMVHKRLLATAKLWQEATGNDGRWPDLVVLIDWLLERAEREAQVAR